MIRATLASRRGATAAEFALILLPVMGMLFGTIEFGRLFWTRNALQEVAVLTARCMSVRQAACVTAGTVDIAKARAHLRTMAAGFAVAVPDSAVTVAASGNCGGRSGFARIDVSLTVRTMLPLLDTISEQMVLTATGCAANPAV